MCIDYSESAYGNEEGFTYKDVKGRAIAANQGEYPVSGFIIEFEDESQVESLIENITNTNWIDEQTTMISIETNVLHDASGVFMTNYVISNALYLNFIVLQKLLNLFFSQLR